MLNISLNLSYPIPLFHLTPSTEGTTLLKSLGVILMQVKVHNTLCETLEPAVFCN